MGKALGNLRRATQGDIVRHDDDDVFYLFLQKQKIYSTTLASDAALESKILAFFAQRAALALSHVSHLTDTTDLSCFVLDAMSQADLLARLPSIALLNPPTG